ncbi:MAG: hypothetical protein ACRD4I_16915 [Candidatus Angelobacter sp.]
MATAFAVLPPLWPAAKLFTLEQPARPGSHTGLAAAFFAVGAPHRSVYLPNYRFVLLTGNDKNVTL